MDDPIRERGKVIEGLFFAEADAKLLAKLREEMATKEARDALQQATGVDDDIVLNALLEHHITPETLTTIGLVPLIAVAWADKVMEGSERKAILQAAEEAGIDVGSTSHDMLEMWLQHKPHSELFHSWRLYMQALKKTLDPVPLGQLQASIMGRAADVARAAGGFLGLGNKISEAEQNVLDDLSKAFD